MTVYLSSSLCPPFPHSASSYTHKPYTQNWWIVYIYAEICKMGPLNTFCSQPVWNLRMLTSISMVQPSPHWTVSLVAECSPTSIDKVQSNIPWVYSHVVFQNLIWTSTLSGEVVCSFTTRTSPVAGKELQVPGCGQQVAATPKCAILL